MTTDPRSDLTEARALLRCSLKWLRRIEDREEDLPASFFDNSHPKPLRKTIESFLLDAENIPVDELRAELAKRGIDTSGLKEQIAELIAKTKEGWKP